MSELKFTPFRKIPRYNREVIVTEKIDGTNASVLISEDGQFLTASRNRWITPDADNFGFSKWAHEHKDEITRLGPGHHFGEWWGSGIQRGYELEKGERRWNLFNTTRWSRHDETPKQIACQDPRIVKFQEQLPECIGVVPVLWTGLFEDLNIPEIMFTLAFYGSVAAPGFKKPEGIVIYHTAGNVFFKKTLSGDRK